MRLRAALLIGLGLALCCSAFGGTVRLTMYDDGLSCPGQCDAHVVFESAMNGSQYAHLPGTKQPAYGKCRVGSSCEICLESGERQCIAATYRGNGPHPMTFDFTPAFYEAACNDAAAPPLLRGKCQSLRAEARSLSGRKNCIVTPDDAQCRSSMASARAAQQADRTEYDKCTALGEGAYNATQPKAKQRSLGCAYEAVGTGANSKHKTWKKLLPGACREGSYVGRDGLDCCSGSPLHDGPLDTECRSFYPKPQPPGG